PNLISLLTSAFLAGAVQSAVIATGTKALRLLGIQMALLALPGGGPLLYIGSFIIRAGHFTLFLFIESKIREPIFITYNNGLGIAQNLREAANTLASLVHRQFHSTQPQIYLNPCPTDRQKRSHENCQQDEANVLFLFFQRLQEWLQLNLLPIKTAHQNWLYSLNSLSFGYNRATDFYFRLLSLLNSEEIKKSPPHQNPLLVTTPLFNVFIHRQIISPKDWRSFNLNLNKEWVVPTFSHPFHQEQAMECQVVIPEYFDLKGFLASGGYSHCNSLEILILPSFESYVNQASLITKAQVNYVHKTAESFFNFIEKNKLHAHYNEHHTSYYHWIKARLLSKHPDQIGHALRFIRFVLKIDEPGRGQPNYWFLASAGRQLRTRHKRVIVESPFQQHLAQLYFYLGNNPEPLLAPGELYFREFEEIYRHIYENLGAPNEKLEKKYTPYKLFEAMFTGEYPEKGTTNLITNGSSGFSMSFNPPRIWPNERFELKPDPLFAAESKANQKKPNYQNLFLGSENKGNPIIYLVKNFDPSLLKGQPVDVYWQQNVDSQISFALDKLKTEYEEILDQFRDHLRNKTLNKANLTGHNV
ncbi:MAG: hypothetical protein NZ480_00005, partial [Bdellovibrionaceae bacterium]|nr:hypothetical protein [Pseudobdellovibrionaceae bacterium]